MIYCGYVKSNCQYMLKIFNNKYNIDYVGYLGPGFAYSATGFAHNWDQRLNSMDQDRAQRVLSNALFTFSPISFQSGEKPRIL